MHVPCLQVWEDSICWPSVVAHAVLHSVSILMFGYTVKLVVGFTVENEESFLRVVGAVSLCTNQVRVVDN